MANNDPIRDIERRAWTLYFEDGLWDVFLGLVFLGGGLRALTDNLWCYLLVAAGVLLFVLGKRRLTLPRVGQINYGQQRKARLKVVRIVALAATVFTATVLIAIVAGAARGGSLLGWVFVVVVSGVFLLMATMMNFGRLYGYTILVTAFMVLSETYGDPIGAWAQIVAGLVPLAVGTVLLVRFLHSHRAVDQEALAKGGAR